MLVDSMDIDMPVFVVREAPSWVEPIKEFLINGTLPVDENESRRIQRRSKAYTIINGEVYKRSVTGVLQRCVEPEEGREMLEEIHRGECGHHASSRALVAKVFRHGFYWPTALDNAEDLVRKCNGCQRSFRRSVASTSIVKRLLLGFIFLLIKIIFDVMRGRNEGAHFGVLIRVRAILPLGGKDRVQIGFRAFAHSGEGIQVELRVPGTSDAEGESAPARAAEHCHSRILLPAPLRRSLMREKVSGTSSPGQRVLKSWVATSGMSDKLRSMARI
ncbi:hypothetical protein QYE76_030119 [Lolium multiflorum]|uniref:Integrase zinc-binding domain-containing protein n=1 Tax=Lolium multiflorum TaxID=4521 RepID=A0AAD8QQK1_LOLMU|nr:hypothetical protein QYE76_030119 [Lolium multiflorum]